MTTGKALKKLVRDIQDRTGWPYQACLRIVSALGYERVSEDVDANPSGLEALRHRLASEAHEVDRLERGAPR